MYKITKSPRFAAPIRFTMRAEDGSVTKAEFTGVFKRLSQEERHRFCAA